jgi:hypothetical protein
MTVLTEVFVSLAETKRFSPIGGVTNPIANVTTMITPNCTRSMFNAFTIGRSIGVTTSIEAHVSIKHPMTNNKTITINMNEA